MVGVRSEDEYALQDVDVEEGRPNRLRGHQEYPEEVQER